MEKPRDHARLLSPDEIDGLDTDSHESHNPIDRSSLDSTAARLREYEGSQAYQQRNNGGIYSSIMARLSPKTVRHAIIGVGVALLLILAASMLPSRKTAPVTTVVSAGAMTAAGEFKFEKPNNVHISGVIFYGRAKFVDVLDCYLQKNLAVNGGMLDDVLFMENTDNKEDIAYLHDLVARVPQYKRVPVERQGGTHGWGGFDSMWKSLQDDNTIYMKIDDDIVWIGDDAVPHMISTLLEHPEAHDIAGNIINSPLTNWVHYHQDAVHPFLPEKKPPVGGKAAETKDWRISSMPTYDDSIPDRFDWGPLENRPDAHFKVGDVGGPPFEGHRWLPLKNDSGMLLHTPIESAQWDAFGRGWKSWSIGAQQHYSLLYNLEHGMLDRYYFGRGDGLFNMQYQRYNLNFLAIWGKSVAMQLPGRDDEEDLTVTIPLKFKRPCLINTRALVAHFNFGTQPEIQHTDLLDRYRLYANEFVCKPNNQKKPLTPTQG